MIRNKILDIKTIFKKYLKILKACSDYQINFYFTFLKIILKIILKNN